MDFNQWIVEIYPNRTLFTHRKRSQRLSVSSVELSTAQYSLVGLARLGSARLGFVLFCLVKSSGQSYAKLNCSSHSTASIYHLIHCFLVNLSIFFSVLFFRRSFIHSFSIVCLCVCRKQCCLFIVLSIPCGCRRRISHLMKSIGFVHAEAQCSSRQFRNITNRARQKPHFNVWNYYLEPKTTHIQTERGW